MGLLDKLRRHHEAEEDEAEEESRISRFGLNTEAAHAAPSNPVSPVSPVNPGTPGDVSRSREDTRGRLDVFRPLRSRSASTSSVHSQQPQSHSKKDSAGKRFSQRLSHLQHHRTDSSGRVPDDLPQIVVVGEGGADAEAAESQWEQRATLLAETNGRTASRARSPSVSSKAIDADIQEAIALHERGRYDEATEIFARLADEDGANNALSQVLYGLALRHGWGCPPNPSLAVKFLTAAASNAASVEQLALQAGLKRGGAAKGELVLAIFELANCFRHGWGIDKDPIAAKQYYETAANLGDSDAMNEVAWCYLEGYGCRKDKFAAARYYRLAEKAGNKTLGNSWIWKDKYDDATGR